jgi:hypothetical protein
MQKFIRLVTLAAAGLLTLQLVGCAQMAMTQPTPSIEMASKLRTSGMAPAALGNFALDASKPASMDKSIGIRANSLQSPVEGSFAKYLRETLKVELESAGLLDPKAQTVITGTLTAHDLDPAIGTAKGMLASRFVVTRSGAVRFDRELKVESSWESSFMGAVAIPLAAGQYEALYRKLVAALVDDADFRKALAKN